MVDAVVVGSGPNGLVAAVTLAAQGHSVTVVEASDNIGGGCRSAEVTLPGFVHDLGAAIHALGAGSPLLRALPLERHGLEWLHPDIPLAHPLQGDSPALLHRSIDDTALGLGKDERAWRRLFGPLVDKWEPLLADVLGPVLSVPRHPITMARFGLPAVLPASTLRRIFSTEQGAALFAGCAAHAFLPLERPLTSSFGILLGLGAHAVGWPVARGGSQAIPDALASHLVELGGTVETGRPIRQLSDLPPHRVALFDTNPAQVASIAGDRLTPRYRRRLQRYQHGPAAFKIDYALDEPMPWTDAACLRAGTVHVGGTFDEIAAATRDVAAGRMPERPFVLVAQQSLIDPSRAPSGKHTLWVYGHVPSGYEGDATDAIERQLDRFAPGFRDVVLARHTTTPAGFEAANPNLVGGDIAGGAHGGTQLILRPTVRAYRTTDPSVFICSASTPPGGGVHGASGYQAARRVLTGPLR